MSEPEFIPSGAPHSVEVAEGSHVAKSKSAHVGTDVRQNLHDETVQNEQIDVDPNQIILTADAASSLDRVKAPRVDAIERASRGANTTSENGTDQTLGVVNGKAATTRRVYEAEMQEMDFPARMIHLKLENDAVRAKLEDLQLMMGDASNESQ